MTNLHHILRHFARRLRVYLWYWEHLKVEREAEPAAIRLFSSGTSCQNTFGKQTLPLLIKFIVMTGSGDPETSHSYAAISCILWPMMRLSSLCSLYSTWSYHTIVVINLCLSFSAGIPGLVLWCLLTPRSCPLSPQLVEADGCPAWIWLSWRFLLVKREFSLPPDAICRFP